MTLRSAELFSGLPASDLAEIAAFTHLKQLERDEYLFREGAAPTGFYVVQQGGINVHRVAPTGKEQVIHVFRAGESFAEAALASPTGYPADARAIESTTVLLIPKTEVLALLTKRPDLALRMLGSMSQHLRVLVSLLDDLTLKDVETRLAYWLVQHCPKPLGSAPVTFKLPTTKRVLAAELGTTAETLSRTLASFRKDRLITVRGSVITILNPRQADSALRRRLGARQ